MNLLARGFTPLNPIQCLRLLVTGVALYLFGGCATSITVSSTPPGALLQVESVPKGATPVTIELAGRDKPYVLTLSKDGYATETLEVRAADAQKGINVPLQELRHAANLTFTSTPSDANITIDGKAAGRTPVEVPVVFERPDKNTAWRPVHVTFSRADYQTESQTLADWKTPTTAQPLELLHDQSDVAFAYTSADGQSLEPELTVDGSVVERPKGALHFEFFRATKSQPWSTHRVVAEIRGIYLPKSFSVERTGPNTVKLVLDPVTEVEVTRNFPRVEMTPTGASLRVDSSSRVGAINVSERGSETQGLARISRFDRREVGSKAHAQYLNSYAITPDGQNVIMSITLQDERGNTSANLFVKKTDDESGGVSRLTDNDRYFDTAPVIAPDGSNILVFDSNRSERSKFDIFRVQLVDNRFSGGIARITNDSRFNFSPTYADSNREIVYVSLEAAYALAKPQISSVRFDGSLPTQLQINAWDVSHREIEHIYFVNEDESSHKSQIYSALPDGKLETQLIADESFRNCNCFSPVASFATPRRILFVSDREKDDLGRPQNDIYVMNADGSGIQRLTNNPSDDIQPSWSPTEPDVVYFLSNRGGAYNIWRMRLSSGR